MSLLLDVQGVSKSFGGLQALSNVSLQISHGEIAGLIGPNGAGKTTLFNVITGLYEPNQGRFALDGVPYQPRTVHEVARAGIARTFQNIRLFADMTVLENVKVGQHVRTTAGPWDAIFKTGHYVREERLIDEQAHKWLEYVGIGSYAHFTAKNLSYGHQRRLEIARALATHPKLLALDEPAAGMNATEKLELRVLLEKILASGVSILLIEHDVKLVMGLCHQVTVLDYGQVIACGDPTIVQQDPRVIEAYLGREAQV